MLRDIHIHTVYVHVYYTTYTFWEKLFKFTFLNVFEIFGCFNLDQLLVPFYLLCSIPVQESTK